MFTYYHIKIPKMHKHESVVGYTYVANTLHSRYSSRKDTAYAVTTLPSLGTVYSIRDIRRENRNQGVCIVFQDSNPLYILQFEVV